jgi:Rieske Fe-S protein
MINKQRMSRSGFLKASTRFLLWFAGALGLGGLIRFFSYEPEEGRLTTFDIGSESDFHLDGKRIFPDIPAVVIYAGGELLAYSLRCTHLGCTLEDLEDTYACPCHGSIFSQDGRVLTGPAAKNLPELQVEVNQEGRVILNTEGVDL